MVNLQTRLTPNACNHLRVGVQLAARLRIHKLGGKQNGFSLLEVLLALMLLALLMTGAYSAISATTKSAQRGEALIDRTNRIRTTQELIRRQLGQALSMRFDADEKNNDLPVIFEGDREQIRFVAPMPGYLGHGGAYLQTIRFERKGGDTKLVFEHELMNGREKDKPRRNQPDPVVLFEHIERGGFEFQRLDESGKMGQWRDDWDRDDLMPLLIKIDIEPKKDSNQEWPELVVPVRVDPGAAISNEPRF